MKQSPLTICLVTADRPKEFEQAILSLSKLNFQDFDLIVADDSQNNQAEFITKKYFPAAHYFWNSPPLGEVLNSNKCIEMASTELVCLLHDDDQLVETYLDKILPAFEAQAVDMAYTGRIIIDETNKKISSQILQNNEGLEFIYKSSDILDFLLLNKKLENYRVFINTPGLVFKKSLFMETGGFDVSVDTHCDLDWILKALLFSQNVLYVNKPLYFSRIWKGSSGRTKSAKRGEVFQAMFAVIKNFTEKFSIQISPKYAEQKKAIYQAFVKKCNELNGPLIWIALRFNGPYHLRVQKILETMRIFCNLNPSIVRSPKFYFISIVSLCTPQLLLSLASKYFLKIYNDKK